MLRTAKISGQLFQSVVGVSHSLGSGLTKGVTIKYPDDFDAVILTGTSTYFGSVTLELRPQLRKLRTPIPQDHLMILPMDILSRFQYPRPTSSHSTAIHLTVLRVSFILNPPLRYIHLILPQSSTLSLTYRPLALARFRPSSISILRPPALRAQSTSLTSKMTFLLRWGLYIPHRPLAFSLRSIPLRAKAHNPTLFQTMDTVSKRITLRRWLSTP